MTFDKKAYQREYMKRRRAGYGVEAAIVNAGVSLELNEGKIQSVQSDEDYIRDAKRDKPKFRPLREILFKCPEGYDKKMWEYAVERAIRARNYAQKMPEHVRPNEVRFQDPEWQYQDQMRYPLPSGLMRD